MAHALLITQCLQNDFVGPLGPHEPPPCRLHVGSVESERLLGRDPASGPVAQLLGWARGEPHEAITILHVRDQHRADDASQADHLRTFGSHCLVGSEGARLVLGLDEGRGPNETYVDAKHLNDVVDTDLEARLRDLVARVGPDLRVAVVGVWTDAKVTFLCYELITRFGLRHVATSSALTASASREKHFVALDSLASLLGVTITNTPAELAAFLRPESSFDASAAIATSATRVGARPSFAMPDPALDGEDVDALAWLYRESRHVTLSPLSGGFSGARVFAVESEDSLGHAQAPTVLKLGPRTMIGKERVAFERVESILGNDVPRLLATAEFGDRAGLKYAFATMGRGRVTTFKRLYEEGAALERLEAIVDEVFGSVLARFADVATYESCPLLPHYGFSPAHAASAARNVAAILGRDDVANHPLVAFYRDDLPTLGEPRERHFVSYVHGDLNGANILLDGRGNVWLIDFAHTARRHVLADLIKFESDLLFLFQDLPDRKAFDDAVRLVEHLGAVEDLAAELTRPAITHPSVVRAFEVTRLLRRYVARYCREDRAPIQHRVGALRYAAHTLSFDEANETQKRLALVAAEGHARAIVASYRDAERLRVDFVPSRGHRIGMTICPGRRDRGRTLERDLDTLVAEGAGLFVCLLPDDELHDAGVPSLLAAAEARGIRTIQLPIADQHVPARDDLAPVLTRIGDALTATDVVVCCMGGLGRSGTVVASYLVSEGAPPDEAIARVRAVRGPRCIENARQEAFVRAFRADG